MPITTRSLLAVVAALALVAHGSLNWRPPALDAKGRHFKRSSTDNRDALADDVVFEYDVVLKDSVVVLDDVVGLKSVACKPTSLRIVVAADHADDDEFLQWSDETLFHGGAHWGCDGGAFTRAATAVRTEVSSATGRLQAVVVETVDHPVAELFESGRIMYKANPHQPAGEGERLRASSTMHVGKRPGQPTEAAAPHSVATKPHAKKHSRNVADDNSSNNAAAAELTKRSLSPEVVITLDVQATDVGGYSGVDFPIYLAGQSMTVQWSLLNAASNVYWCGNPKFYPSTFTGYVEEAVYIVSSAAVSHSYTGANGSYTLNCAATFTIPSLPESDAYYYNLVLRYVIKKYFVYMPVNYSCIGQTEPCVHYAESNFFIVPPSLITVSPSGSHSQSDTVIVSWSSDNAHYQTYLSQTSVVLYLYQRMLPGEADTLLAQTQPIPAGTMSVQLQLQIPPSSLKYPMPVYFFLEFDCVEISRAPDRYCGVYSALFELYPDAAGTLTQSFSVPLASANVSCDNSAGSHTSYACSFFINDDAIDLPSSFPTIPAFPEAISTMSIISQLTADINVTYEVAFLFIEIANARVQAAQVEAYFAAIDVDFTLDIKLVMSVDFHLPVIPLSGCVFAPLTVKLGSITSLSQVRSEFCWT